MKNTLFLRRKPLNNKQGLININRLITQFKTLFLFILICLFLAPSASSLSSPNQYEAEIIRQRIVKSFSLLIQNWKEELYFEMYALGQMSSKKIIKLEEFAQRMVDLRWKPVKEEFGEIKIIYRNFATITCNITFQNKINSTREVEKTMIIPVILEEENWRFDLLQMIKTPFEGKHKVDIKEIPKEIPKEEPKEETAEEPTDVPQETNADVENKDMLNTADSIDQAPGKKPAAPVSKTAADKKSKQPKGELISE